MQFFFHFPLVSIAPRAGLPPSAVGARFHPHLSYGIIGSTSMLVLQPRFRQINVSLNSTEDFIADHVLIPEF
jgi:hypothetical protein